jgi:hypothetical protein
MIFAQPDAAAVAGTWDEVRDQLAESFPRLGPSMGEAKAEGLAFTAFPGALIEDLVRGPVGTGEYGDQARTASRVCSLTTLL